MLTIGDFHGMHNRRSFLRVGSLALGGLSLPMLFQAKAHGASTEDFLTNKSVIFLFMQGGPSQIETFDPKMSAPVDIHSSPCEVDTALPGMTFGRTCETP